MNCAGSGIDRRRPDALSRFLQNLRIRAVLPHISGRCLDIGCGDNRLIMRYPKVGFGVDVFPWPGVDVRIGPGDSLPFRTDSFQTVTIVAALNHIVPRQFLLREGYRVLAPEGRLLVTMIPAGFSRWWHQWRHGSDRDQGGRQILAGEVYGFSRQEVVDLLEQAGFQVMPPRAFMLGVNTLTIGVKPGLP